jgi:hypothetical protein
VPLVVVALDERLRRERVLVLVGLLTSLLYLTRPDNVIIALPLLVRACCACPCATSHSARPRPGGRARRRVDVLLPRVLRFPVSQHGVREARDGSRRSETLRQGTLYLIDSVGRDPLTMTAIIAGAVLAFGRGLSGARALATGVPAASQLHRLDRRRLHVGTLPDAAVRRRPVIIISRLSRAELREWMAASALLAIAGASSLLSVTGLTDRADNEIRTNGVVNERAIYFKTQVARLREPQHVSRARLADARRRDPPLHRAADVRTARRRRAGLAAASALARRVRAVRLRCWLVCRRHGSRTGASGTSGGWFRTSTSSRSVPVEFDQRSSARASTTTRFGWSRVRAVCSARLDGARIWHLNTGASDHLINQPFYRYQGELATLDDLAAPKPDGTPFDAPGVRIIKENLAVSVEPRAGRRYLDISLDPSNGYLLTFIKAAM